MYSRLSSGAIVGVEGLLVEVETYVYRRGFPIFTIVGLPGKAVEEARERIRTALANSSFPLPDCRITINLAPADIPKGGTGFDLPMAVSILAASGVVAPGAVQQAFFAGELALDGSLRPIPGIVPLLLSIKGSPVTEVYLPAESSDEAALFPEIPVIPAESLGQIVAMLRGTAEKKRLNARSASSAAAPAREPFLGIKGQIGAKRLLEIAAAGFHNALLTGPPGTGKTALARALPDLLPPLSASERLEVACIHSAAGGLSDIWAGSGRPFRSPHHSVSRQGLIGGGANPRPGEVTLAHRGVLFLDELPEFPRTNLEALRQPLEDGYVTLSRVRYSVRMPCRFQLIATANPCPCGYLGHGERPCACSRNMILSYQKRLSGPLLDRIDLFGFVESVREDELFSSTAPQGVSAARVRERVLEARERQNNRFADYPVCANSEMSSDMVQKLITLPMEAENLLCAASRRLNLSTRGLYRVLKTARTIADLDGSDRIESSHIAEAVQYRMTSA